MISHKSSQIISHKRSQIKKIHIIGAGLAGCEAAWQCASLGVPVVLYEMKPLKYSPAHHIESFAELVCSNSLKGMQIESGPGLLKEEMRILDSLIIQCADATKVPAGGALAVDREAFSNLVTEKLKAHPLISVLNEEVTKIPKDEIVIIASGPLTEGELYEDILEITSDTNLHFFDAAAPVIETESIDMSKAFKASRYGKGEDDYINCPMNREEYLRFYNELIGAEMAEVKGFDGINVFEGCMPVEVMAKRGVETLRFGPLKPVGLPDPRTGKGTYAVVQLRQDNSQATLYNMVGFQTRLKFGEQKRVFSLIPGLENAVFARYGVMHRNTFINSPKLLESIYRMKKYPNIYFAGQITGVEGYVESASSGLVAGINAALDILGKENIRFGSETAIGALSQYISDTTIKKFQPMNINFGIIQGLNERIRDKKQRYNAIAMRAIESVRVIKVGLKKIFDKNLQA
jgi:methylenetetrahydrofolate--tRNA-(uracil-5-)-methyltransferase